VTYAYEPAFDDDKVQLCKDYLLVTSGSRGPLVMRAFYLPTMEQVPVRIAGDRVIITRSADDPDCGITEDLEDG
jgi:hypothetical protein